ncbi:Chemotaxis protein CheV [Fundidesulfovibrio magnetotacticus]|uniref:Chemotaxis protein CheV n=1 Tax=Fundidesulfovibrio magnetotacticus TaxID=2730080 RepID=A0A6V8M209_9BACT|nr:chemotaxis protein [Fundidesulfovibrio magnetotacticus]GFK95867.1 Chemotaxis protein CheV [Fundidesulfovibrio magnetotacticus]
MAQTNILLEAGTNELEIVEFFLDEALPEDAPADKKSYKGYYGVNVAKVLEIIRLPKITALPEVSHPSVLGAFNLRNHIIPLVDLSVWLDKNRVELESPKVIVTEFNKVTTAFMVSGVTRIHRLSWEAVEPPNNYVSTLSGESITGVVKLEDRIVFLLDLEKIVADLNPQLGLRLDTSIDWRSSNRYRALIADDSALIREMLRDLMEKANFDVEVVTTGLQAWERLQILKQKAEEEGKDITDYVQVVVSDIEMPTMDGHNLTKRIKDDHMLRVLPVLLFSSLITDKLRHKGEAVGADDQISKPEVSQLALRAKKLIEERLTD